MISDNAKPGYVDRFPTGIIYISNRISNRNNAEIYKISNRIMQRWFIFYYTLNSEIKTLATLKTKKETLAF